MARILFSYLQASGGLVDAAAESMMDQVKPGSADLFLVYSHG